MNRRTVIGAIGAAAAGSAGLLAAGSRGYVVMVSVPAAVPEDATVLGADAAGLANREEYAELLSGAIERHESDERAGAFADEHLGHEHVSERPSGALRLGESNYVAYEGAILDVYVSRSARR
ncbi:hypothetical protein [Halovivax sp.]|uniref:hypothetical protein n=1 Tax=Halovivax sp. TaxID=1935978 RepID=UPI0025BD3855|nr:hypothetical protein [Halovivax sp.]